MLFLDKILCLKMERFSFIETITKEAEKCITDRL
jgi:hypothetical protein